MTKYKNIFQRVESPGWPRISITVTSKSRISTMWGSFEKDKRIVFISKYPSL